MIDDNKIEEAAVKSANYLKGICDFTVINAFEEGFKEGAKWAVNELLKDLWHPAKDIPEQERPVLVVYKHGGYSIEYWKAYNISGQVNYLTLDITQWLYVDELFPKKGDNHD